MLLDPVSLAFGTTSATAPRPAAAGRLDFEIALVASAPPAAAALPPIAGPRAGARVAAETGVTAFAPAPAPATTTTPALAPASAPASAPAPGPARAAEPAPPAPPAAAAEPADAPIRYAFGMTPATDGGPPLGPDEAMPMPIPVQPTAQDVLRALNPLQHIPLVGTIYRAATGDEILPVFRVLGGALFGGVPGMLTAAVVAAIEDTHPLARLQAALRGEPDPTMGSDAVQRRMALAAYAMQSGGNGNGA